MAQALSGVLTPERLAALRELAAKHGVKVKDLPVFGSYARGEAKPESDLDLLVDIEYGRGCRDASGALLSAGARAAERERGGDRGRAGPETARPHLPRSAAALM